jgi:hypothetical protein
VRWALFPALAGVAGAAGGAFGGSFWNRTISLQAAVFGGAISAGAALASMLTTRAWPSLVAAPALGMSAICSAIALAESFRSGGFPDPRAVLEKLVGSFRILLLLGTVILLHTAVHRIALRRAWPVVLASGAVAAILSFALPTLLLLEFGRMEAAAFLSASTLAQVPAVLAARALARRLRPQVPS